MMLRWAYTTIFPVLVWKLTDTEGCTIFDKDLAALPMDRVLIEDRDDAGTRIAFWWESPEKARERSALMSAAGERAAVSELQGRAQKQVAVFLWKYARDCTVYVTPADRAAIPHDRVLYTHGHADHIEYRFIPRHEAERMIAIERFNEGRSIIERP